MTSEKQAETHPDQSTYLRFTTPQIVSRELTTLSGILKGIHIDGTVTPAEIQGLMDWMTRNQQFERKHPFGEIFTVLLDALADGVLTEDELADIVWLCDKYVGESGYFDAITGDIQQLHGILAGIAADGRIEKSELIGLREWLQENDHLKSCWPYDEIEAVICHVLKDGVVDQQEHAALLGFFSEFVKSEDHRAVDIPENWGQISIQGICSVCPEIDFSDRVFCFTGSSARMTRKKIAEIIESAGGQFSKSLTKSVQFLVIGAEGNPCWTFSCYGRKVEQAVELRRSGHQVVLVHEYDFWDAALDAGVVTA